MGGRAFLRQRHSPHCLLLPPVSPLTRPRLFVPLFVFGRLDPHSARPSTFVIVSADNLPLRFRAPFSPLLTLLPFPRWLMFRPISRTWFSLYPSHPPAAGRLPEPPKRRQMGKHNCAVDLNDTTVPLRTLEVYVGWGPPDRPTLNGRYSPGRRRRLAELFPSPRPVIPLDKDLYVPVFLNASILFFFLAEQDCPPPPMGPPCRAEVASAHCLVGRSVCSFSSASLPVFLRHDPFYVMM